MPIGSVPAARCWRVESMFLRNQPNNAHSCCAISWFHFLMRRKTPTIEKEASFTRTCSEQEDWTPWKLLHHTPYRAHHLQEWYMCLANPTARPSRLWLVPHPVQQHEHWKQRKWLPEYRAAVAQSIDSRCCWPLDWELAVVAKSPRTSGE